MAAVAVVVSDHGDECLNVVRDLLKENMRLTRDIAKDPAFDRALGVFRRVYETERARGRVHAIDREDLQMVHEEASCEGLCAAIAEYLEAKR